MKIEAAMMGFRRKRAAGPGKKRRGPRGPFAGCAATSSVARRRLGRLLAAGVPAVELFHRHAAGAVADRGAVAGAELGVAGGLALGNAAVAVRVERLERRRSIGGRGGRHGITRNGGA